MKTTVLTFRKMKRQGEKISMLTCYDYTTARLMDGTVDGILVGIRTEIPCWDTIPRCR